MINAIAQQYLGYLNTPSLWKRLDVYGLQQLELPTNTKFNHPKGPFNKRLGKRVEQFFSHELKQHSAYRIDFENLQIKADQTTIGELDIVLTHKNLPIHVEIIYKFYLYDNTTNYKDPLEFWIGPNRNDTLLYKIHKLKDKQLPLLYHPKTKNYLKAYGYDVNTIKQFVCFKAQLFKPYRQDFMLGILNDDCVAGFFLNYSQISDLKDYQFYIPDKRDWLVHPHNNVNWQSLGSISPKIIESITQKWSPLVWLKQNDYNFKKCFITWW